VPAATGGCRVPKAGRIGNVSVWFDARFVLVFPLPPPHATSTMLDTPPTARALRIRNEVGVIAFSLKKPEARASSPPRLLPGVFAGPPGRERADEGWRPGGRLLLHPHCGWAGRECPLT